MAEQRAEGSHDRPSVKGSLADSSPSRSADGTERHSDVPPTRTSEASTRRHSSRSRTTQSRNTSAGGSRGGSVKQDHFYDGRSQNTDSQAKQGALAHMPSHAQGFPRAYSEPKLSDSHSQKDSEGFPDEQSSHEAPNSERIRAKDPHVDQVAFESAAYRLQQKRVSGLPTDARDFLSSNGSDANALLFENRRRTGDANTRTLIDRMRIQRQRKQARLSHEEKTDLMYSLKLFEEDGEVHLHEFGKWLENRIQRLEVENIGDIVDVESCEPGHETEEKETSQDETEKGNLHDVLIKSIVDADPWLRKCESILEPYASLAEEVNHDITLLETQRENSRALQQELETLLQSISFTGMEQGLIDDLDVTFAIHRNNVDYSKLHEVINLLTSKSREIAKLSKLSNMSAVTNIVRFISDKQNRASTFLLPALKEFLDNLYIAKRRALFGTEEGSPSSDTDIRGWSEESLKDFRKGLRCIAVCENNSLSYIVDHYVELASSWTTDLLQFLMQGEPPLSLTKDALDVRMERFAENLLYSCLLEGDLAFRLLDRELHGREKILPSLLRRQLPSPELLREFLKRHDRDDKGFEACIHQHFWHSLDFFGKKYEDCSGEDLRSTVSNVEVRLRTLCEVLGRGFPVAELQVRNLQNTDEATTATLASYRVKCRILSLTSQRLVETHANDMVASLSESLDLKRATKRAVFFSRVKEAVDLCIELSSPLYVGVGDPQSASNEKTKSICEMLIGAALRRTEIASAGAGEQADDVKLQCYGYIAAKLREAADVDYLARLAHLSNRVREHVMCRWTQRIVLSKMFHGITIETTSQDAEVYSKVKMAVASLDASTTIMEVRKAVHATLEEAAKTCVILPFYTDMMSLIKERVEDMLRKARNNKYVSDIRPTMRSFTSELLSSFRKELEIMRKRCR